MDVQKWLRPPPGIPRIEYEGRLYEPDFIAETDAGMFLCEVKADDAMDDPDKAGSKPWTYVLVNETRISAVRTFANVVREHAYGRD